MHWWFATLILLESFINISSFTSKMQLLWLTNLANALTSFPFFKSICKKIWNLQRKLKESILLLLLPYLPYFQSAFLLQMVQKVPKLLADGQFWNIWWFIRIRIPLLVHMHTPVTVQKSAMICHDPVSCSHLIFNIPFLPVFLKYLISLSHFKIFALRGKMYLITVKKWRSI